MADAAPGPESPEDELKRKFREALDRKRGQQAEPNARQSGQGRRKGPRRARPRTEQARSFRRKSGG